MAWLEPGAEIDRYVVEALVGEGGVARVYRVRHRSLGTVHALKVLAVTTARARRRSQREARVQASLQHPHLVAVQDAFEVDGAPCLLMEYIRGPTLQGWLADYTPTDQEALRLFRGVLDGVRYAHAAGLVHRDLKPGNVMLDVDGPAIVPKVTDFGLVKILGADDPTVTATGMLLGTPAYGSPEQLLDPRSVDARGDVFSLGCVLYEMLCGKRPFDGPSIPAIYAAVSSGTYERPASVRPDLDPTLAILIDRMLEPDPADRPDEAELDRLLGETHGDLDPESPGGVTALRLASDDTGPTQAPTSADNATVSFGGPQPVAPARRRSTAPLALGAVALLALVAAGVWQLSTSGSARPAEAAELAEASAEPDPQPTPTPPPAPPDDQPPRDPAPTTPAAPAPAPAPSPAPAPAEPNDGLVDAAAVEMDAEAVESDTATEEVVDAPPEAPTSVHVVGDLPSGLSRRLGAIATAAGLELDGPGEPAWAVAFGDQAWSELRAEHPGLPALAVDVSPTVALRPSDAAVIARPDPDQLVDRLRQLHTSLRSIGAIHDGDDPWWRAFAQACNRRGVAFDGRATERLHLQTHLEGLFSTTGLLLIAPAQLWTPDALATLYGGALDRRGGAFPVVGFHELHFDAPQAPTLVARRSTASRDALAAELADRVASGEGGGTLRYPDLVLVGRSPHALIEASGLAVSRKNASAIDRFHSE